MFVTLDFLFTCEMTRKWCVFREERREGGHVGRRRKGEMINWGGKAEGSSDALALQEQEGCALPVYPGKHTLSKQSRRVSNQDFSW